MFATQWEPSSENNRLSREINRLFNRSSNGDGIALGVGNFPALNLWEDDGNLYAEAELPGFDVKELEIYVTGDQLTLKGERNPPAHDNGAWHRKERAFGKFTRIVELPAKVNSASVSAEFKNGVLKITLPKSEAVKPRRIEIKNP